MPCKHSMNRLCFMQKCTLLLAFLTILLLATITSFYPEYTEKEVEGCIPTVYVAIMSGHALLRQSIRDTWASWTDCRIRVRFYVDYGTVNITDDMVELPSNVHCPNKKCFGGHDVNMAMVTHALTSSSFDYYVRLDDDAFVCPQSLLRLLDALVDANQHVYMGNFYVSPVDAHADEFFVLLSRKLLELLAHGFNENIIVADHQRTFAINIAYWIFMWNTFIVHNESLFFTSPHVHYNGVDNICASHVVYHQIKDPAVYEVAGKNSQNQTVQLPTHLARIQQTNPAAGVDPKRWWTVRGLRQLPRIEHIPQMYSND